MSARLGRAGEPRRSSSAEEPRRSKNQAGFTLLEILVAVLVFTIGALALAFAMSRGVGSVSESGQHTRASAIASQRTENLLAASHSDPLLTPGSHSDPNNPYPGNYFSDWTVEDNQPITGCKRITISVRRGSATAAPMVRTVVVSSSLGS
jgi:prepilin-type N-terminal cleavage/methylation domain-containing protein